MTTTTARRAGTNARAIAQSLRRHGFVTAAVRALPGLFVTATPSGVTVTCTTITTDPVGARRQIAAARMALAADGYTIESVGDVILRVPHGR